MLAGATFGSPPAAPADAPPTGDRAGGAAPVQPGIEEELTRAGEVDVLVTTGDPQGVGAKVDDPGARHLEDAVAATVDAAELEELRRDPTVGAITLDETFVLPDDVAAGHGVDPAADPVAGASAATDAVAPASGSPALPQALANPIASMGLGGGGGAWAQGYRGSGSIVAVLDTGVDAGHPALSGRIVGEACFTAGSCPNGQSTQVGSGAARPYAADVDGYFHGTFVAGLIASRNGTYSGLAPDAQILAVKVFSRQTDPAVCGGGPTPCTTGRLSDLVAAMRYVRDVRNAFGGRRLVAANLSLGFPAPFPTTCDGWQPAFTAVVSDLRRAGVVTVAASGNAGWASALPAPACVSEVLAVGATDSTGPTTTVAPFTSSSVHLDAFAPGVGLASTIPGGRFLAASGTSFASPLIAATLAILGQVAPHASATQREAAIVWAGWRLLDQRNGIERVSPVVPTSINRIREMTSARAARFNTPTQIRALDTRHAIGVRSRNPLGAGQSTTVDVAAALGVPASSIGSVVVNLTAVAPTSSTWLTVHPSDSGLPNASHLNLDAGGVLANRVTVKVGSDGKVRVHNANGRVHVIVDINGYFHAAADVGSLNPARLADTRYGWGVPRRRLCDGQSIVVDPRGRGVPTRAGGVALNVTAVNALGSGWVSVLPANAPLPATTSNLNFAPGQTIAGQAWARLSPGGFRIVVGGGCADVLVDVLAWLPASSSSVQLLDRPARVFDTRATGRAGPGAVLNASVAGRGGLPGGSTTALLNTTVTQSTSGTTVSSWPAGTAWPGTSDVNVAPGATVANLTAVAPGANGQVSLFNSRGYAHLVLDAFGYFKD